MSRLTRYFTREEFACKCGCGFDTVDAELLLVLERIRWHFKRPVLLSWGPDGKGGSGCRCPAHNADVGGAPNSQHLYGRAADFKVMNVAPAEVQTYLGRRYRGRYGIGAYPTFTHVDTRSNGPARWQKV